MFPLEPIIRLGSFAAVLTVMGIWEGLSPRHPRRVGQARRWFHNLAMASAGAAGVRLLLGAAAAGVAAWAEMRGVGILNVLHAPRSVSLVTAFLVLDFVVYAQHWAFHTVPVLWRFHRMHHTDLDIDTSSGVRFHPVEIMLSMLLKMAVVAAVGAPPLAVVAFEVVLNAAALFNHGNVKMPEGLDRALRLIVVTPDMHRVHHSVIREETDSNFGFNLVWWDRLLGTYRAQPAAGHESMQIGLEEYQDPERQTLWWLLALPFAGARKPARERST